MVKPTYNDVANLIQYLDYEEITLLKKRIDANIKQRDEIRISVNRMGPIYDNKLCPRCEQQVKKKV